MHATGSGSIWETPFHASMDAAALAIGCPSGPVRYVIRFAATPLYANLSAISIAACKTNQLISLNSGGYRASTRDCCVRRTHDEDG
jgi:hypothetical protein